MMNKSVVVIVGMLLVNVIVCNVSFAVDVPTGFTKDQAISDVALGMAKQQFKQITLQLQQIAPGLPPDQKAAIEQAIIVIDDKLNRLDRIDVFFTQEITPGESYKSVSAFYADKLSLIQDVSNEEIQFAITQAPPKIIPQETLDSLAALVKQGKVRAATGSTGNSRVTMSTVYVDPNTFKVIEGTTIVIATDK